MLKFSLGEKCHASKENQNNQFGIPFTILQMPHTSEIIIVECGARKRAILMKSQNTFFVMYSF